MKYVRYKGQWWPVPAGGSSDAPPAEDAEDDAVPDGYVTQAEHDKVVARMKAADRHRSLVDQELERVKAAGGNDAEAVRLKRENALLRANAQRDRPFLDVDDVLAFLPEDTADDDVPTALDSLAEARPYLLREHAETALPKPEALVQPDNRGGTQSSSKYDKNLRSTPDAAPLERKYPSLRRSR